MYSWPNVVPLHIDLREIEMNHSPKLITGSIFFLIMLLANPGVMANDSVIYKGPRKAKALQSKNADFLRAGKNSLSKGKESDYVYDPKGKPDPFESFIAKQEAFKRKKKHRKPKTYLETLELSQLELIAIIISPKGKWAMVRDSKGIGHVIREGTAIGTNGGIVYKILPGRVIIRERYVDFRGNEIVKEVIKKLRK